MKPFKMEDINYYHDLLKTLDYEIIAYEEFGDYQGDCIVFFKKDNNFGYLQFGYGSCSGCDVLQSLCTQDEYEELQTKLNDDIQWKSAKEMLDFIENRDWEGCVSFYNQEQESTFKELKIAVLKRIVPLVLIEK